MGSTRSIITPTLEEAKECARNHTVVPLALEVFADQKTPIEVLRSIKRQSDQWFILESVHSGDSWSRYSFLGHKPVMSIRGTDDMLIIKNGAHTREEKGQALTLIRETLAQYKSARIPNLPPFTGGFVGFFAYDFVKHFISGLHLSATNEEGFDDFHLMLIDKVIAFDHFKQKIYLIVNIPAENIEVNYIKGVTELKDIETLIRAAHVTGPFEEEPSACGSFSPLFSEETYKGMVNRIKEHIHEGDVFQAVVSNRFKAPFSGSLMNTYRLLRTINPSPYMVYLRLGDMEIACSSPETLVSLRDGEISSFPLAGTCPRGATEDEDVAFIEALLHDEKELAEHDMLVDLARNDIGRVSCFGSVKVRKYRFIKQFSHVSHIASHVTGMRKEGLDALDVIAAALPAGTLSGAPKKRACELIDEVEGIKRGVYGGALGYIDFTGNMDMCIGIRMAVLKAGAVYVQAGAGIVADSVPEKEYQEANTKAQAVMKALKESEEM